MPYVQFFLSKKIQNIWTLERKKQRLLGDLKRSMIFHLIRAVKNLLDFGISKQAFGDEALEASLDRGLKQSELGEVTPHEDVMKEIRARYKA